MTSKEIADLRALINRSRPPKSGMEIHFLRVLDGTANPCSSKENEWYQWAQNEEKGAPQHLSAAELTSHSEAGGLDIASLGTTYSASHQATDKPAKQQAREKPGQEDIARARSVFERISSNDFSSINELREQRSPVVFELLRQLIRECLEKSQDRKIRDTMVRAGRKIHEVEHGTVLPDGGSIVNFGGLHDLRTWDWK